MRQYQPVLGSGDYDSGGSAAAAPAAAQYGRPVWRGAVPSAAASFAGGNNGVPLRQGAGPPGPPARATPTQQRCAARHVPFPVRATPPPACPPPPPRIPSCVKDIPFALSSEGCPFDVDAKCARQRRSDPSPVSRLPPETHSPSPRLQGCDGGAGIGTGVRRR
jgi:hypothetical protein